MSPQRAFLRSLALVSLVLTTLAGAAGCMAWHTPAPLRPAAFAVLADVQYADKDTQGRRHYRTALTRLEECVTEISRHDLAFVVQLGDLIDGHRDQTRTAADHDTVMAPLAALRVPLYHVLGNHCLTLGRETLLERYRLPRFYYDFTTPALPGWRFVVLDGNDAGYGVIGPAQLAWFETTLEQAATAAERVICLCHFALLKEAAPHHRMAQPEPLLAALDRTDCVVAWFAGHDHAGGYALRRGVHHVTIKGMVEAPVGNAYAIIEVHPDRLHEVGFGTEPTRDLPLPPRLTPPAP